MAQKKKNEILNHIFKLMDNPNFYSDIDKLDIELQMISLEIAQAAEDEKLLLQAREKVSRVLHFFQAQSASADSGKYSLIIGALLGLLILVHALNRRLIPQSLINVINDQKNEKLLAILFYEEKSFRQLAKLLKKDQKKIEDQLNMLATEGAVICQWIGRTRYARLSLAGREAFEKHKK